MTEARGNLLPRQSSFFIVLSACGQRHWIVAVRPVGACGSGSVEGVHSRNTPLALEHHQREIHCRFLLCCCRRAARESWLHVTQYWKCSSSEHVTSGPDRWIDRTRSAAGILPERWSSAAGPETRPLRHCRTKPGTRCFNCAPARGTSNPDFHFPALALPPGFPSPEPVQYRIPLLPVLFRRVVPPRARDRVPVPPPHQTRFDHGIVSRSSHFTSVVESHLVDEVIARLQISIVALVGFMERWIASHWRPVHITVPCRICNRKLVVGFVGMITRDAIAECGALGTRSPDIPCKCADHVPF